MGYSVREMPLAPRIPPAPDLFGRRPYWARRFGIAPVLPTTREEMETLGWDSCDVIVVTGDAYVDHPSFGMAIIGRLLEAQGFRVGILPQPGWHTRAPFEALGRPNLFFGVTAGNMDSMVNRYTSDRKIRHDDAYTPGAEAGRRPDRSVVVYAQRCREAFDDVPVIIGGIEASLRRIAHYDYWSDRVQRSILLDSNADMLVYGNAERQIVEIAHRLAAGEAMEEITDLRGTAFIARTGRPGFEEIDSTRIDRPGPTTRPPDPYANDQAGSSFAPCKNDPLARDESLVQIQDRQRSPSREHSVIRLPPFEIVRDNKMLYAHASRVLHLEANPGNARAIVQRHGARDLWINPPPIPLTSKEFDRLYELPYSRCPHPRYGDARLPAYEMIRFSITIQRGCFGGCSFCSITEHEGRIIQNRSEASILREIEQVRDTAPGFTGIISDLGGPTANMYRLACDDPKVEAACRRPSCVYPGICERLNTDHSPLIQLYRKARKLPGVRKVLIASGVRYDLAVQSPQYVQELVTEHVGGYLKIAPEHTQDGPLSLMLKPGISSYDRFKALFERYSQQAGKKQYLIPYFIAAHPGTQDTDMLELALWLKRNGYRADQVQAFLPSPMANATTMYHTRLNPLRRVRPGTDPVHVPKGPGVRRLHKAFLRWHDANNWPLLRSALERMGRTDLIGDGQHQLVPSWQPQGTGKAGEGRRRKGRGGQQPTAARTQHTFAYGQPKQPNQIVQRGSDRPANPQGSKRPRGRAPRLKA